ncbi:MAG: hypothetical protein HYZ46_09450, partial [Nitrosomonadales bacterium]|nr:hypothetical protein [Nitrosomonadales bacterium]
LEQEAAQLSRQRAELEQREIEPLRRQVEQSRADVSARQLLGRLRSNKRIGTVLKAAGLVSAMGFIGVALPLKNTPVDSVSSGMVAQRAAVSTAEYGVSPAAQLGVDNTASSGLNQASGRLKMTDHLGE